MKIDLSSLYFNGDTITHGNTASWGTALGQTEDYSITAEGAEELMQLIRTHHFDFDPSDKNYSSNIRHLDSKIIVESGRFESVWVNNKEIQGPFFLLIIEETKGNHIGRKSLKYNNKTKVGTDSNMQFYQRVQNHFGADACWFIHDIFPVDGELHMSAVKVSDEAVKYKDAKERSTIWKSLIDGVMDYTEIQKQFKQYCLEVRKIQNESSVNEYIRAMPEVLDWFIDRQICDPSFEIWNIHNDISSIQEVLKGPYKKAWQDAAQKDETGDNGFKMAAWNRWTEFIEWHKGNTSAQKLKRDKIKVEDLNTILYGPPGTGKTFSTIDRVVEIVEPENYRKGEHDFNKERFDQLIRDQNVFFTTFHQSMSYEDFIEGIKPVMDDSSSGDVSYKITPGIFKIACAKAAYNAYAYNNTPSNKDDFEHLYELFINFVRKGIDNKDYIIGKSISNVDIEFFDVNEANSIRGRSKGSQYQNQDWLNKSDVRKLYDSFSSVDDIQTLKDIKDQIDKNHPRKTELYAVLNSLLEFKNNEYNPLDKMVSEFDKGTYTQSTLDHGLYAKPVVLVIDEINRGNVSSIFGELITLIEGDKRMGQDNEIPVILPYSKVSFSVPPNLFILGTMNTADRSVEALDTALRRRFNFIEMLPKASLLEKRGYKKTGEIDGVNLKRLLENMNKRIEVLVDRDHTIGHAFFIGVGDLPALQNVFFNKVIPLLQEYFYGDYSKMEMVIGEKFLKRTKVSDVKFAVQPNDIELDGVIYQIKNPEEMSPQEFITALKVIIPE